MNIIELTNGKIENIENAIDKYYTSLNKQIDFSGVTFKILSLDTEDAYDNFVYDYTINKNYTSIDIRTSENEMYNLLLSDDEIILVGVNIALWYDVTNLSLNVHKIIIEGLLVSCRKYESFSGSYSDDVTYTSQFIGLFCYSTAESIILKNIRQITSDRKIVDNWDKTAISMYGMFEHCDKLKYIDFGNLQGSLSVLDKAFEECRELEYIDLSQFKVVSYPNNYLAGTGGYGAFSNCIKLKEIKFGHIEQPVTKFLDTRLFVDNTFYNCKSLESIIVPDDTGALQIPFYKNIFKDTLIDIIDNKKYAVCIQGNGCIDNETLLHGVKSAYIEYNEDKVKACKNELPKTDCSLYIDNIEVTDRCK